MPNWLSCFSLYLILTLVVIYTHLYSFKAFNVVFSAQGQEGNSIGVCQKCSAWIYGVLYEKGTSTGTQSDIIMLIVSAQCTLYLSYFCSSLGDLWENHFAYVCIYATLFHLTTLMDWSENGTALVPSSFLQKELFN